MPATWLTILSWVSLGVALGSAAWIVFDIYGLHRRQQMAVMEAVWPVTALYFGSAAVVAYRRFGRPTSQRWRSEHAPDEPPDKPDWATTAFGICHCGAGCTLGDIIAEFAIFGLGASIAGITVMPKWSATTWRPSAS